MYSYGGSGKSQLKDKCIRKTFLAVRGCFAQPFISKSLIFVCCLFIPFLIFLFYNLKKIIYGSILIKRIKESFTKLYTTTYFSVLYFFGTFFIYKLDQYLILLNRNASKCQYKIPHMLHIKISRIFVFMIDKRSLRLGKLAIILQWCYILQL